MTGPTVWWVNQYAVPPTAPGGTRHYDMSAELRRQGWDVRIVASDLELHSRRYRLRRGPRDVRSRHEVAHGVPFVWLWAGTYRANNWLRVLSMLLFSAHAFTHLVRRARPEDLIVGSSPHLPAAGAAYLAARLRRLPFVLEVRDLWPESYEAVSGRTGGPQVWLMRRMADHLYLHADQIVVLAEGSAEPIAVRGVPMTRISCIPNGVDTEQFSVPAPRKPDDDVRFIYAGAHGPANGLETLVEAAALVGPGIEFTLLGDGPSKPSLQAGVTSRGLRNVHFADPVPKKAVGSILANHDVGLMILADHELFARAVSPNKLFDYMAAGLPIVNNVPGAVRDLVADAEAGWSCGRGPTALAQAIDIAAAAVRMGKAPQGGRDYVRRHFDRRMLASELDAVLRSVSAP